MDPTVVQGHPAPTALAALDIAAWVDARGRERGSHPCLIWVPPDAPPATWTYARFAETIARVAGGLAARGVRAGDRVLVHLENCPEMFVARFALARLGAVCVATNAAAAGPELGHFAAATQAVGAITQPRFAALLGRHCADLRWIALTDHDGGAAPAPGTAPSGADSFAALLADPAPRRPAEPMRAASIMFTTGTTAPRPKAVVWTHANALWAARLGALANGIRAEDVYHLFLPAYHVVGFAWSFLPALWAGATILLEPRFSASRYWNTALRHGATIGSQVIYTSRVLAGQPVPREHRFRQWTDAHCRHEFETRFGVRIVGGWGMTEIAGQAIVGDPHSPQPDGTIGRPAPGYEIQVVDDDGRTVEAGGTGHLLVRAPRGVGLFSEYLDDPQANAQAFDPNGYFRTGDRVQFGADGFIRFADRAKDMLKVGGEGVSPAEIEQVIRSVEGVREVAVVGRPDARYGEVPVALVVVAPGAPADLEARALAVCGEALAKFKLPREIRRVDAIPKIGFGKINKAALRAALLEEGKDR